MRKRKVEPKKFIKPIILVLLPDGSYRACVGIEAAIEFLQASCDSLGMQNNRKEK